MRILIRTSKWAIWARRFGSFAVPLAVIPILLHRERVISSSDFHVVELVAMGVAALALFLALGAFVRLWITGDQGWSRATAGLVFAVICLAPMAFVLSLALRYPDITDVSTDFADPPALVSAVGKVLTPEDRAAIESAFPNARTRTYPFQAAQMFALVAQIGDQKGWEPRARRSPQTPLEQGELNAVATTLLGWRDEVAVRVRGNAQGSVIDMRSTATHGWHDLGENGRRIEDFMLTLDQRITLLLRDAPAGTPAAETDTSDAPAVTADE